MEKLYLAGLPRLENFASVPHCRGSCFADESHTSSTYPLGTVVDQTTTVFRHCQQGLLAWLRSEVRRDTSGAQFQTRTSKPARRPSWPASAGRAMWWSWWWVPQAMWTCRISWRMWTGTNVMPAQEHCGIEGLASDMPRMAYALKSRASRECKLLTLAFRPTKWSAFSVRRCVGPTQAERMPLVTSVEKTGARKTVAFARRPDGAIHLSRSDPQSGFASDRESGLPWRSARLSAQCQ